MSYATVQTPSACAAELASLREALVSLHEYRVSWEREVTSLFDEFENLAIQLAMESSSTDQKSRQAGIEQLWLELAEQNAALAKSQSTSTVQLSDMRGMIEQQSALLAALVGAATRAVSDEDGVHPPEPDTNLVSCSRSTDERSGSKRNLRGSRH